MTPIDLTKKLKKYKTGWVAFDNKYNVVAHAETFTDIEKIVRSKNLNVTLMAASDDYFGFVT